MGEVLDNPAPPGRRILVAENEPEVAELLRAHLAAAGFLVAEARDGKEARRQIAEHPPALLILGWTLPKVPAIDVLRDLRAAFPTRALPVIVIARGSDETERVRAFEAGADDLVTNPLYVGEVLARVEAVLRRAAPDRNARVIRGGDVELDPDLMCVRRRGKMLRLGQIDYRILEFFLKDPDRVHTRAAIIEAVWRDDAPTDYRTIDVYIGRLRKSLLAGWRSDPIKTVRGVGYRFEPK